MTEPYGRPLVRAIRWLVAVACVTCLTGHAGTTTQIVGTTDPKLVVAQYTYGQQGSGNGVAVDAKIVFSRLKVVEKLQQCLRQAEEKDITFYMYDCFYLIFLNDHGDVEEAYVYYPVTKPHGGFLKAKATRVSSTSYIVKQDGYEAGVYSPAAAEVMEKIIPEEMIWTLKE